MSLKIFWLHIPLPMSSLKAAKWELGGCGGGSLARRLVCKTCCSWRKKTKMCECELFLDLLLPKLLLWFWCCVNHIYDVLVKKKSQTERSTASVKKLQSFKQMQKPEKHWGKWIWTQLTLHFHPLLSLPLSFQYILFTQGEGYIRILHENVIKTEQNKAVTERSNLD